MRTLEEIRERCHITEDGHWLWRGSLRPNGRPNIYAPDYTAGGKMQTQQGPRAVWHCSTGKPIPEGHRVFGGCDERTCCNPACMRCTTCSVMGANIAKKGTLKGQTKRILANRATNRARSVFTPEILLRIQASDESGVKLAKELGVSRGRVSRARRGELRSFQGVVCGVFAGLGAR